MACPLAFKLFSYLDKKKVYKWDIQYQSSRGNTLIFPEFQELKKRFGVFGKIQDIQKANKGFTFIQYGKDEEAQVN